MDVAEEPAPETRPDRPDQHGRTVETVAFGPLRIQVDNSVLWPRPWTHTQSVWAGELLADLPAGDVLELCSGAGQIGLAAVHGTGRRLVMVDSAPRACELARLNLEQVEETVEVREGRFDAVLTDADRFVLVVADPPWVPSQRVGDHPADPHWAIDGGMDGLEVARRCIRVAAHHLHPEGRLLLQVGTREQVDVLARTFASVRLEVLDVREEGEGESTGVLALAGPSTSRG